MDAAPPEQQPASEPPKKPRYSKARKFGKQPRLRTDTRAPKREPKPKKKSKLHWRLRPGKPNNIANKKYEESRNLEAQQLAMLGLTDAEIAKVFKVTENSIHNWEKRYPKFKAALERGRYGMLAEVGVSLYKRAIGYDHPDGYVLQKNKDGVKEMVPTTMTHRPADVPAIKYILSNRAGKQWQEKTETQVTGTVTGMQPLVIAITQAEMPRAKELKQATATEVAIVVTPQPPVALPQATEREEPVRMVETVVAVEPSELPKPASGRFKTFQENTP